MFPRCQIVLVSMNTTVNLTHIEELGSANVPSQGPVGKAEDSLAGAVSVATVPSTLNYRGNRTYENQHLFQGVMCDSAPGVAWASYSVVFFPERPFFFPFFD